MEGLLCGFGNGLQFMGGRAAGYAVVDAVQVSSKKFYTQKSVILFNSAVYSVGSLSFKTERVSHVFSNSKSYKLV